MNETCDRCGPGTRAAVRLSRGTGELCLCAHCGTTHYRALAAQGWTSWPLGIFAPQHAPQQRGTYWIDMPDDLPVDMSRGAS